MPKPFLPLVGERTLFEATLHRCADPEVFARPIVVTGAEHVEHVEAQSAPGTASIVVDAIGERVRKNDEFTLTSIGRKTP